MRVLFLLLPLSVALTLPAAARPVTIEDVRDMAFNVGIVRIEEIELKRNGVWKVEGDDPSGHEIKMKVDAATGQIIKLERDD
jgi:uncharacterized membrane protein YkoI